MQEQGKNSRKNPQRNKKQRKEKESEEVDEAELKKFFWVEPPIVAYTLSGTKLNTRVSDEANGTSEAKADFAIDWGSENESDYSTESDEIQGVEKENVDEEDIEWVSTDEEDEHQDNQDDDDDNIYLGKDVKELKQVDHSLAILATIRSQVPTAVDEYLGSSLGDALQEVLQKLIEEIIQQSSQKDVSKIIKIHKEQAEKQQMPEYSVKSSDKAALDEYD
ncbi:hypothetical protein Tco_0951070 [Tanacetum coccineum]|uniref:Uncharacterized protein n=1 Tax=Tanacetum coccineum TaxID=301880 RepID=A0ABQ5DTH1_9ASTR